MKPAWFNRWGKAQAAFQLTDAELHMAMQTGLNATLMEVISLGKKHPRELSPVRRHQHSKKTPSQIKAMKQLILERYVSRFGEVLTEAPTLKELKDRRREKGRERRAARKLMREADQARPAVSTGPADTSVTPIDTTPNGD